MSYGVLMATLFATLSMYCINNNWVSSLDFSLVRFAYLIVTHKSNSDPGSGDWWQENLYRFSNKMQFLRAALSKDLRDSKYLNKRPVLKSRLLKNILGYFL